MKIFIDDREFQGEENETVLQVALRYGLTSIPSLCFHPALKAEASCRLCVVEVQGETSNLAAACSLKVRNGLAVNTKSSAVVSSRRRTLHYLLQRAPGHALLKQWAREYQLDDVVDGVTGEKLVNDGSSDRRWPGCLLCGRCVNACRQLNIEALQFNGKGQERQVSLMSKAGATVCIGCRACERLCPTQVIQSEIQDHQLRWNHWDESHPLAVCAKCHEPYATQAALNHVRNNVPASRNRIELCPECKRLVALRL